MATNEDASTAGPKAQDSTNKAADVDGGDKTTKVRLLAKLYMRPIPGTTPIKYKRYRKGAVLNVSEEELRVGNEFKASFEVID